MLTSSVQILRVIGPGHATTRSEGWLHIDVERAADVDWLRNHRRGLHGPVEAHLAPGVAPELLDAVLPLVQRCTIPAEIAAARSLLVRVRQAGCEVGVSVGRHTPVQGAFRFLEIVDAVVLVNDPRRGLLTHGVIDKVLAVRCARASSSSPRIVVDGVCATVGPLAVAAGAGGLVVPDTTQVRAVREAVADELRFAESVNRMPARSAA